MVIAPAAQTPEDNFLKKREGIIILLIIAFAVLRLFFFNTAFPFFNNVDEQLHFDMVYKYARGDIPIQEETTFSPGSAELIVQYETKEYNYKKERFRTGQYPPPLWTFPHAKESRYYKERVRFWDNFKNRETWVLPLPYFLEAQWLRIGKVLGMEGGHLLYWLRFLNIPVFALLVWLSCFMAKRFFPDKPLMFIGIPLVLAFFPQDLFYAITNDIFSALFCGLAFFLLLQVFLKEKSSLYHALAGLSVALAFLLKISNIALPALFFVILFLKGKRLLAEKRFRAYLPRFIILLLCAGIPVGILFLRNYLVFGSLLQNSEFIKNLGWTSKPLGEIWNHPIFTLKGFSFFLTELTKTFWRGEFLWHGEPLAHRGADIFYIFTTFLFLFASLSALFFKKKEEKDEERFILMAGFFVLLLSLLFLALLSIRFDFGDCINPSKESPFFLSGRLISGITIPFFILYISGLKILFEKAGRYFHPIFIVLLIVILISVSEISLTLPVLQSKFNWFHILASRPVF